MDHGWVLPDGLATYGNKNPLNFILSEWQQVKRQGIDPREIKQMFREVWERSDTLKSFQNALAERGYFLAKGDRRGFVAVGMNGEVYALSRLIGEKAKAIKAKLGSSDEMASVSDVRADVRSKVTDQLKAYIAQTKAKHRKDAQPLADDLHQTHECSQSCDLYWSPCCVSWNSFFYGGESNCDRK
ncbi:hypothetical protein [Ascidiaceihabitans sp.]|uniref:hypothetical protein n=1 Tax=Ascidiaceihabitans sp. TaxID=1872644 RepID=UPI00329A759F